MIFIIHILQRNDRFLLIYGMLRFKPFKTMLQALHLWTKLMDLSILELIEPLYLVAIWQLAFVDAC